MKGIILAGGLGTRLYPLTLNISKQLLPIYDKPMIYYPLSTLMLAGIKEILIISNEESINGFDQLLGNGKSLGLEISYAIQKEPNGIAEAFIIGKSFIGLDDVTLILGDNMFFGNNLSVYLSNALENCKNGYSTIFGSYVTDPNRFGIVEFDRFGNIISLEEKPNKPRSSYAVVGLYCYTNEVINIVNGIVPSERGELEITSVNNEFLLREKLKLILFERGIAWLDTGTFDSLLDAINFVGSYQKRTGLHISNIEEIALRKGFISPKKLEKTLIEMPKNEYYNYLRRLLKSLKFDAR